MVTCKAVAKDTQRRYGMFTYVTQGACGYITSRDQISVPRTKRISIAAKRLFLSPNCNGVNATLKSKLRIKGRTTKKGRLPLKYKYATYPKEIAMIV
jgi:hypothetical protein